MITNIAKGLLFALCAFPSYAQEGLPAQDKPIRFTCAVPEKVPELGQLTGYYRKAFARLGYDFEMVYRPTRRALAEAINGTSHGDCARIVGALDPEEVQYLIPVDVVIGQTHMSIWSLKPGKITLDQLSRPEHRVCYVEGNYSSFHWTEKIKALYPSRHPQFVAVPNHQTALKMLQRERLTHCIGVEVLFDALINIGESDIELFNNGAIGTLQAQPVLSKRYPGPGAAFYRSAAAGC